MVGIWRGLFGWDNIILRILYGAHLDRPRPPIDIRGDSSGYSDQYRHGDRGFRWLNNPQSDLLHRR